MPLAQENLPDRPGLQDAAWVEAALADAAAPMAPQGLSRPLWEQRFAAAGRECSSLQTAEAVRILLLHTASPAADVVTRIYQRGTGTERRAVLLALPHLRLDPGDAVALIQDALRANDTRLLAAAVGTSAALHLDGHAWRHAVLKCLFTGVPAALVYGLEQRARGDRELARMLRDFAAERTAAGRPVPDDLSHILSLTAKEA
ncbi:EboA domain-containing protein [Streptomyces sp. NPDC047123]|uniref:EboA domain-containing protein n=1 Tax=Streptomyces sp. NPDC047123 TaxID=3155622 RepID=UPI0034086C80